MALPSRKEVEGALERGVVGDVKWLGAALLEALDHLVKHAPSLVEEAEQRAAQRDVDDLRTLTANRSHLDHDAAREKLADAEKRLDELAKQQSVKDPDLGAEQNPLVDSDPDRGPKTEVATHTPSADDVEKADNPAELAKPPYDTGSSAPTSGAHAGESEPGQSADTIEEAGGKVKKQEVEWEDNTPPGPDPDTEPKPREPTAETEGQDVTKADLYERAKELDVEGRSTMSKDELAKAVEGK